MTDLSNPAINCTGWSLIESIIHSTTTADLETARVETPPKQRRQVQIVPVLDPAIGVAAIRDRYQKDECDKDATFARWLAQLAFRYQAEPDGTPRLKSFRDGNHWWQHTLPDWADECGCTVKQVRGYLDRAQKKGLIEKHQWRAFDGKYRGKTVMHVRLLCAEGAAALNGWPDFRQIRMIRECPFVTCYSNALEGTCKDLKEEALKEEENLNINSAPVKATGAAHVQNKLLKTASGKGKAKAMEEPSAEAMTAWEDFEEAYRKEYVKSCLIGYEEIVSDYMVPGWPDSKRQALQRYEYAVANKEGLDPVAVLRSVTPGIWQYHSFDYAEDARPNPLYLLKISPALCARYRAELLKATKSRSHRAFKAFDGVRAMRARVRSALKKAIKQQGNGWFKEQTEAEKAESAAQVEAAKKKAVQLAIEQHEKWEATNAEGLANGDPMAVPPYQESEPPPKAPPPIFDAVPVEVASVTEPAAVEPTAPEYGFVLLKPAPDPEEEMRRIKEWTAQAAAKKQQELDAKLKKHVLKPAHA